MIPSFYLNQFTFGPMTFQVWGCFVALGIILGTLLAVYRTKQSGIQSKTIIDLVFWLTLGAFIGGKAAYILLHWSNNWNTNSGWFGGGFSSLGAMLFGLIVAVAYVRKNNISLNILLEILGPALLLVDAVGRVGCFLIHEHLGRVSNFLLAVNIGGTQRHDLGLYFAMMSFLGFVIMLVLGRYQKFTVGTIGYLSVSWYFTTRLILEFLYENGGSYGVAKYFGMTFFQYVSLVVVVVGLLVIFMKKNNKCSNFVNYCGW